MTTAAQMLRRWESLDIIEITGEAIEQTKEEAIKIQQAQLFLRGEKADGSKLKPYKSPVYARKKNLMNPNPGLGQPDAKFTGELYREMFVDVQGDKAVFDSASPHAAMMIKRDGSAIFGLTKPSKDLYAYTYMPVVQRTIKFKTGCT